MKPIIIVTVHRRYRSFLDSLTKNRRFFDDFREKPYVVIVWAEPEESFRFFFNDLLAKGLCDEVLERKKLSDEEGESVTYKESHNIRLGLKYSKESLESYFNTTQDYYAIVQAGDVEVQPRTYKLVDDLMHQGENAVVFNWDANTLAQGGFHTSFFATKLEEQFWPPVSTPKHGDVLEWQWGKQIHEKKLVLYKTHNWMGSRFTHNDIWNEFSIATPIYISGKHPINIATFLNICGCGKIRNWFNKIRSYFKR